MRRDIELKKKEGTNHPETPPTIICLFLVKSEGSPMASEIQESTGDPSLLSTTDGILDYLKNRNRHSGLT
jgi:hypothetical protein